MRNCARFFPILTFAALSGPWLAAQPDLSRPRITGISHVAYFVSDLPKAVAFWHDFLGFDARYSLNGQSPSETGAAFVQINERQHVELLSGPPAAPPSRMSDLCFAVDSLDRMRAFLIAHGYHPSTAHKAPDGEFVFAIEDPNGAAIEFVEGPPHSMASHSAANLLPPDRISSRIYHVGYLVTYAEKTIDFYKMLGFSETWRGTSNPAELSWINMKVPDGDDYVELMLYHSMPTPAELGSRNHLSLLVPDIEKAAAELDSRTYFTTYGRQLKINTGVNQKRQLNLYDPDGTRVELMEPNTITGKPAESSTAPYPVHPQP